MKNILYSILALIFLLSACKEEEAPKTPGDLSLNFELNVGAEALAYETTTYTNAAGNDFTVKSFWMYLSNISLLGANGTEDYVLAPDYYLIEGNSSTEKVSIDLPEVPAGSYAGIQFSIGVDSPTNTDISAVKGDLDPSRAWNWNTGYKFVSLEGNFLPAGEEARGLVMHIGLDQNYKTIALDFANNLTINGGQSYVDFSVDILKMFEGPHIIDFNTTNTIMGQPTESGQVADNYAAGMLKVLN